MQPPCPQSLNPLTYSQKQMSRWAGCVPFSTFWWANLIDWRHPPSSAALRWTPNNTNGSQDSHRGMWIKQAQFGWMRVVSWWRHMAHCHGVTRHISAQICGDFWNIQSSSEYPGFFALILQGLRCCRYPAAEILDIMGGRWARHEIERNKTHSLQTLKKLPVTDY